MLRKKDSMKAVQRQGKEGAYQPQLANPLNSVHAKDYWNQGRHHTGNHTATAKVPNACHIGLSQAVQDRWTPYYADASFGWKQRGCLRLPRIMWHNA